MVKYSQKLDKVLAEINSKFGTNTIIDLNSEVNTVETLCSTGSIGLDLAIGNGYPLGRICEIYGPESSGKSTLCYHAIANVQKQGNLTALIDVENSFDSTYAQNLGVDVNKLIFSQPDSAEMALDTTLMLINSGEIRLIILDSIAGLMAKAEIEDDISSAKMGLRARVINAFLIKAVPACNKNKCTLICTNQLRDNLGSFYGSTEITTGGKGLKFFASLRLDIRRIGKNEGELDNGEKGYISNTVRVKSVKNKCFPPFRECEFDIIYGKGISQESEYISAALNLNILKKTNSGICFVEETPLFPAETPIASSQPKLVSAFDEIRDNENHPLYWVQKEIVLRVKVAMKQITEEELDKELSPIYAKKERENELSIKYLDLASKASSSSKLQEAKYYINCAYNYNPFNKDIAKKYKDITKRYEDKRSSFGEEQVEILNLEDNTTLLVCLATGEIFTKQEDTIIEENKES